MRKSNKLLTIGSDLIGSIIVGLFIGLKCDEYFQTKPICLIIFIILGGIAGILNIIRAVKNFEE